jgi:Flp pilus assembly protein TadG
MVEFALVLPILLLVILGIVDFGKAWAYKNDEVHLANQAARYAAVNSCSACGGQTINNFIKGQAESSELKTGMTVDIRFTSAGAKNHCAGEPIKVTLTYAYHFLGFLHLNPVTVQGSATMRLEKNWGNPTTGAYDSTTDKYTVPSGNASVDTCS